MIQDNGAPKADSGKLRKVIRKKIAEILKDKTNAGGRVYPNATVPPWQEELPVILVYTVSENASKYAEAPRELERALSVTIEIIAEGPEVNEELADFKPGEVSVEDQVDNIAEQVENAMSADETFGGLTDDSILTNTEFEFDGNGGSPIGSARLTYSVTYFTMSPRSNPEFPAFNTAGVDYNIGEDENTREAKDIIALPQN